MSRSLKFFWEEFERCICAGHMAREPLQPTGAPPTNSRVPLGSQRWSQVFAIKLTMLPLDFLDCALRWITLEEYRKTARKQLGWPGQREIYPAVSSHYKDLDPNTYAYYTYAYSVVYVQKKSWLKNSQLVIILQHRFTSDRPLQN
jgi:hypothetical protein